MMLPTAYFVCNLMRMHILRRQEGPEKCIAFALVEVNIVRSLYRHTVKLCFLMEYICSHMGYIRNTLFYILVGKY